MATTSEELIIALRAEGANETKEQIDQVENSMDETATSVEQTAGELEGFSQQFAGAMTAAVAALAVGAAGLLSQVPVIGGAMEGLFAIVEALAFQMDQVLRPVLTPLTNGFFTISETLFELEGVFGDIIGIISTVVATALVLIPIIAKVGAVFGTFATTGAGIVSILGTIAGVITTVGAAIISLPGLIAAVIVAIGAFIVAYLTNWRGARDKTNKIVGQIVSFVVNGFNTFVTKSLAFIDSFTSDVVSGFNDLAGDLDEWATNLASDAFTWGKNLIQRFIDGLRQKLSRLRDTLNSVQTEIEGKIGVDVSDGGGGGATSGPIFGGGTSSEGFQIDGRDLTESTGRFRRDKTNRRGF